MSILRWRYVCVNISFKSIYENLEVSADDPEKQGLKPGADSLLATCARIFRSQQMIQKNKD